MAETLTTGARGQSKTRLWIGAYAITVFVTALAAERFIDLVGTQVFIAFATALSLVSATVFVIAKPGRFRWYRLPAPLMLFLGATVLAIAWSPEPFASLIIAIALLGTALSGVALAYLLTWRETLRTCASALRYLFGAAFVCWILTFFFELPESLTFLDAQWLGGVAALGITVFAVQLRGGQVQPVFGWSWLAAASVALAAAHPPLPLLALGAVGVSLGFALWARRLAPQRRTLMYLLGAAGIAGTITAWMLTVGGDGDGIFGTQNVWLALGERFGWLGVTLCVLLVFVTTWRAWFRAIDPPRRGPGPPLPYATSALWPFLLTVALLVLSLGSDSLVFSGGWLLLVLFCVKTRFDYEVPSSADEPAALPWRSVPIPRGSVR